MELELRRGGQTGGDLDQSKELVRLQQHLEKLEVNVLTPPPPPRSRGSSVFSALNI